MAPPSSIWLTKTSALSWLQSGAPTSALRDTVGEVFTELSFRSSGIFLLSPPIFFNPLFFFSEIIREFSDTTFFMCKISSLRNSLFEV